MEERVYSALIRVFIYVISNFVPKQISVIPFPYMRILFAFVMWQIKIGHEWGCKGFRRKINGKTVCMMDVCKCKVFFLNAAQCLKS